jgi:hypothetical protein
MRFLCINENYLTIYLQLLNDTFERRFKISLQLFESGSELAAKWRAKTPFCNPQH